MRMTLAIPTSDGRYLEGRRPLLMRTSLLLFIAISSNNYWAVDAVGGRSVTSAPAFATPLKCNNRFRTEGGLFSTTAGDDLVKSTIGNVQKVAPLDSKRRNIPSTPSLPYVRIQKRGRHFDVQTAVTTFRKPSLSQNSPDGNCNTDLTVDLHAQIHFGDESYYEYFNDKNFGSMYDKVLYELIVEDKMLSGTTNLRQLTPVPGYLNPIAPTAADRSTASQYGLRCQVDAINYCQEKWIHADLTREEFLEWMERGRPSPTNENSSTEQIISKNSPNSAAQPLWALASTAPAYPGSEVVTALLRPLAGMDPSASATLTRRLFTHLFLPGDALSGWIRAALWCGVPSPELSIMLVDWSSLSYMGRPRRSGDVAGGRRGREDAGKNIGPISPIAAPVFLSLLTGNWGTARRLVFGQVLVGGQSNSDSSKNGVLIQGRNERAMDVLQESLEELGLHSDNDDVEQQKKRIALLYGAGHCRDMHRRLVEEQGFVPVRTEWRTAFRATTTRWGDYFNVEDWMKSSKGVISNEGLSTELIKMSEGITKSMSVSTLESVAVGLVILPLYLLVGGLDWVSTMGDIGNALNGGSYVDGAASVVLYLLRHVALYVAISKFVVDWGRDDGVFEDDSVN